MAHTTDITEGIKWIKINKTDVEGLVNTDNLQEVETLNLKFSDLGVQSFNVVSIGERADYFIIHVDPNNIFETKSIASLLSVNDIEEGSFSGGKYVITPGASATFLDYSIDSLQSASLNTTTGEISTFFPLQTTVEIQVVASQSSSGDAGNVLFAQLEQDGTVTKSVGLGEFESFGVWETKSAVLEVDLELNGNNKIDTFIPRILANGTNSNVVALRSSGTNVIVKQPIVNIENNHIVDERLEAEGLASQVFTLGKDDDAQIENFTASIGTIDDGTFYNLSRPNNFGALTFTASIDVKQGASSTGTGFFTGSILSNGGSGDNNTLGRVFFDVTAASYTTLTWSGSYFITDIDEDILMKIFSGDGSGNRDIDYRNPQLEINPVSPAKDGGETLTIVEPYVSEGNFFSSDCNPIINNTLNDRINEFYMDVDYSSNAITAINSDTILDGSATRAKVQYSNYTAARVVRPRYEGSKNTANELNSTASFAPIDVKTSLITEYNRGGGAWPFIPTKNYVNTSNILIVGDDPSQVGYLYPSDDAYLLSLERFATDINEPTNPESLNIFQYTTTASLQPSSSVFEVLDYGLPSVNGVNYVFQSVSTGGGTTLEIVQGTKNISITTDTGKAVDIYRGTFINNNNTPVFEGIESIPAGSPRTNLKDEISTLLTNNRVFISLFSNESFKVLISGSQTGTDLRGLEPFTNTPLPLEIVGTYSSGLTLAENCPIDFECGDDQNGVIIYVVNRNNSIIFNTKNTRTDPEAFGTGAVTDKFSTDTISQNLIQITRESGNNPTT